MPQAVALALLIGSLVLIRGGSMGLGIQDSFRDVFSRVPKLSNVVKAPTPVSTPGSYPPDVERWRPLVEQYFGAKAPEAMSVMYCESRGNPQAVNPDSQASGLFQHLPKYWRERSQKAGVPGANIFDPEANIKVAAWLYGQTGDWRHWSCKPQLMPGGGGGRGTVK